jgi:hypothetical protein
MERRMRLIVAVAALSVLSSVVFAQWGFRRGFEPAADQPLVGEPKEWTFARLAYDGAGGRWGSRWAVDYPGAEYHFSQAVERLTRIDVHPDGHVVSPNSTTCSTTRGSMPWRSGLGRSAIPKPLECASICCAAVSSWSTTFTARTSG